MACACLPVVYLFTLNLMVFTGEAQYGMCAWLHACIVRSGLLHGI
jgi:hypothetical protein